MSYDDRVFCTDCREYSKSGRCLSAARGERRDVASSYSPADVDLPKRCVFFSPKDGAKDDRLGCERYPILWKEYKQKFPEPPPGVRR